MSPDRAAYGMRAAALVGRVLQVGYWDVHNFADEPATWEYGDWHHAAMGVDLLADAEPSCVLWTDTFYRYGVEIFPTPVSDHVVNGEDGPEPRDVSASDRWQVRLNSPVRNVERSGRASRSALRTSAMSGSQTSSEVDVPVALRLEFAAGPVWMVAGIPPAPQMREVFVAGDQIRVVFTIDRMRQIGFPDSEFLAAR